MMIKRSSCGVRWVGGRMIRRLTHAGLLAAPLVVGAAGAPAARHPNIIFILADDLGYYDLGCLGQKHYATPNLDRLAAGGRFFTNAYSGGAWCAPSRTALLTGRNALHCGPLATDARGCGTTFNPTVADMLKSAGYATFACGKWHMMEPKDSGLAATVPPAQLPWRRGFDVCRITQMQGALGMSFPHEIWTGEGATIPIPENASVTEDYLAQGHISRLGAKAYNELGLFVDGAGRDASRLRYGEDVLRQEAVAFMRANQRKPFFLYYASPLVHRPLVARDISGYRDKTNWTLCHKIHAAMVEELDRSVGVLLDELHRLGLERDTIVMFASDNGFTAEGWWGVGTQSLWDDIPLFHTKGPWNRGKHINTNGGVIVPFIAWGPGRVMPGKTNRVISFHDVMATAAELTGATLPGPTDSVSFVPLLKGRDKDHPTHPGIVWSGASCLYMEMPDEWGSDGSAGAKGRVGFKPDAALLDERFFALCFRAHAGENPIVRLFDITTDTGMRHDLAVSRPDLVARAIRLVARAVPEAVPGSLIRDGANPSTGHAAGGSQ